jgi:micrococcal nuclease
MTDLFKDLWNYRATVLDIVDGDTIEIEVDQGFHTRRTERLRLADYDAWEKRGPEREEGLKAEAYVEEQLPIGSVVLVKTRKWKGKWGRYVAEVWYERDGEAVRLGAELLKEGHAVKYGEK